VQTETVCDCGYSFTAGTGGKPRLADAARTPAFWIRVAGRALGLAPLAGFIGLFGGGGRPETAIPGSATDGLLSAGDVTADSLAGKTSWLHDWGFMYAGKPANVSFNKRFD
jgi:hypothetical protein